MSDFKILKCPSCGSSIVETQSESIITCSHCGSNLVSKDASFKQLKSDNSLIKTLLIVVISLLLFIGVAAFWMSNKQEQNLDIKVPVIYQSVDTTNSIVKSPLSSIPSFKTQTIVGNKDSQEKNKKTVKTPIMSIVSQVAGVTSIGGQYWIITVRNDSPTQVISPRVVMSLFDNDNRRIGEHTGWSKLDTLDPNAETTILVLIAKPPKAEFTSQVQALAAFPNKFISRIAIINVDDFIVNSDSNRKKNVTIVGDVSNPLDFRVDFIRVQAIARNKQGIAVGLADAYVTTSSLATNGKSGFKISASTFITEPAATWSLWAGGRKHREN